SRLLASWMAGQHLCASSVHKPKKLLGSNAKPVVIEIFPLPWNSSSTSEDDSTSVLGFAFRGIVQDGPKRGTGTHSQIWKATIKISVPQKWTRGRFELPRALYQTETGQSDFAIPAGGQLVAQISV